MARVWNTTGLYKAAKERMPRQHGTSRRKKAAAIPALCARCGHSPNVTGKNGCDCGCHFVVTT